MTPTQRTLRYFRDLGYICGIVEKWNHHVGIRQDLFGFGDLICFSETETLLIQATSTGYREREKKIRDNEIARDWVSGYAKRRILVVGWRRLAAYRKDGTRAKRDRWEPKIIEVNFER